MKRVKFWPSKPALEYWWYWTSPDTVNPGGMLADMAVVDEVDTLEMRR